jgi:hypothetical protein
MHWRRRIGDERGRRDPSLNALLLPLSVILACALCAGVVTCARGAEAAPACSARAAVIAELRDQFKEEPTGLGMTGNGQVVELLTSEAGSWTLLLTFPNGQSCLIASGHGWESRAKPKGKEI